MADYKHFEIEDAGGVTVIQLKDPRLFEILLITELHDELLEFAETTRTPLLVIDFSPVKHCSTAVINSILRVKKRLLNHGGRLRLCGMAQAVRDAYQLLNLDGTVFDIHDTRDAALDGFA